MSPGPEFAARSETGRSRAVPWFVALLLTIHAALALWAVSGKSVTSDELLHLTAGTAYWRLHDYRLHPENGILPQRWAAVPAAVSNARFPTLDGNSYWKTSEVQVIGHQFFYEIGNDHFSFLMAGRAMIALFSVGTGLLIFLWSRALFGIGGGLISLGLFTFCPTFLAHGVLATSDMCMTFFFVASCGAWWRHLHEHSLRWWLISAATFGLACVAKHSAVLLIPMMVVMAAARAFAPGTWVFGGCRFESAVGKFGAAAVSALAHGIVAAAVIWAFHGFRYPAFNPALPPASHFVRPWEVLDLHLGALGQFIRWLESWRALPEAFLYGSAYVVETAQVRSAFLNGEYSSTGWVSFFPWAFLLKTTLPLLAATAAAAVTLARHPGTDRPAAAGTATRAWYPLVPLLTLFVVYWAFSLTTNLNIGDRKSVV